jgi:hypothetical protein
LVNKLDEAYLENLTGNADMNFKQDKFFNQSTAGTTFRCLEVGYYAPLLQGYPRNPIPSVICARSFVCAPLE